MILRIVDNIIVTLTHRNYHFYCSLVLPLQLHTGTTFSVKHRYSRQYCTPVFPLLLHAGIPVIITHQYSRYYYSYSLSLLVHLSYHRKAAESAGTGSFLSKVYFSTLVSIKRNFDEYVVSIGCAAAVLHSTTLNLIH